MSIHGFYVCCLAFLSVAFLSGVSSAAEPEKPLPGDAAIERYLRKETERLSRRFLDGATTRAEWEERKPRLRREYFDMLGLWPLPEKMPLHATILYVCGHAFCGRDGNKSAHQDHGMWFASNGYICLITDSLQRGEIPGIHHGTYGTPYRHFGSYGLAGRNIVENRWWWQARGYTPAGVECWNGMRALDYLVRRPDVDADRLQRE